MKYYNRKVQEIFGNDEAQKKQIEEIYVSVFKYFENILDT